MEIKVVVDPCHAKLFGTLIKRELKILRVRGMRVYYKERPRGFFRCRMTEPRFFGRVDRGGFKTAVANGVSGLISGRWEYFFGPGIIRRSQWPGEDIDWGEVCAHLNENRSLMRNFRHRMFTVIARYLDGAARINVAGFVRFRLAAVRDAYAGALAAIVDEQLFERENEEFIRVLKRFTSQRGRCLHTVHVVIEAGSRFRLYDADFTGLTESLAHGMPLLEDEVRNEDLLIAALLTLSPQNIVLHGKRCLPVTRETLGRVFGAGVSVCGGCDRCSVWIKA